MILSQTPLRIGVICPSDIAFRRFLPSLTKVDGIEFAGVAVATPEEWNGAANADDKTNAILENEYIKAQKIQENFGGKIFAGYNSLITSEEIDAVYLPLPPALHFRWAEAALKNGKHAYVEKPFTTSLEDSRKLIDIANDRKLAVHENYMFVFHRQLDEIKNIINSGELGKVRQYRISFGFPLRPKGDFRYCKNLGGGAVLDAGGYCIRLASWLLGPSAKLVYADSRFEPDFEVDIFGSGIMRNDEGTSVQFSFGMDCDYKCQLEAWGSKGTISTDRILTAPDGLEPGIMIKHNQDIIKSKLHSDTAFCNSIRHFIQCVNDSEARLENYRIINQQSNHLDKFIKLTQNGK